MYPIRDGEDDVELTDYQLEYRKLQVMAAFISHFLEIDISKVKKWGKGKPSPQGVVDDMRVLGLMLEDLRVRFHAYLDAKAV